MNLQLKQSSLMDVGTEINDENWCCMVILLVESDFNLTNYVELFERTASNHKDVPIIFIKPKDFKIRETNGLSPKQAKWESALSTARQLRNLIMKRKIQDIEEQRIRIQGPSAAFKKEKKASPVKHVSSPDFIEKKTSSVKPVITPEQNSSSPNPAAEHIQNETIFSPKCGPFCYFILTKFYDACLPGALLSLRIPLIAVLELIIESKRTTGMISVDDKRGSQKTTGANTLLKKFWNEFIETFDDPKNSENFADTLFLPINISKVTNFFQTEDLKSKGELLFDYMKGNLFALQKHMRQYIHYINNLEIVEIPKIEEFSNPEKEKYEEILSGVPLECTTVEIIVHSLVEQVLWDLQKSRNSAKDYRKQSTIPEVVSNQNNEPKEFDLEEEKDYTVLIPHRDYLKKQSFHFRNLCLRLKEIHSSLYNEMPYAKIWDYFPQQSEIESIVFKNHLQKLHKSLNICVPKDIFINSLHLLFFNKMYNILNGVKMNYNEELYHNLVPELFNPMDSEEHCKGPSATLCSEDLNKSSEREHQLQVLKKYLECDEVLDLANLNGRQELYSYYYSENLPSDLLYQALHKAFYKFSFCDFEYSRLTDSILIWFHNDYDENGLYRTHVVRQLPTAVGFRDYYIHLSAKEEEWLKVESPQIYQIDVNETIAFVNRNNPSKNTLTLLQEKCIQIPFPRKQRHYYIRNSSKNPRKLAYSSLIKSIVMTSENTTKFYSVDGAILTVKKSNWVQGKQCIDVCLDSHGNNVYLNTPCEKTPGPESQEYSDRTTAGSIRFHIQTKKGVHICLMAKKMPSDATQNSQSSMNKISLEQKKLYLFDVAITLPNGLMITFVKGEYLYVKQKYINSTFQHQCLNEEDYRIFLSNGTVIVFMTSGSVVILYPNSTETRIKVLKKIYPYMLANTKALSSLDITKIRTVKFVIDRHEVISPSGNFTRYQENKKILKEQAYNLRASADNSKGLYTIRTDGTKTFTDLNGVHTVLFCDGTIITSTPREEEEEETYKSNSFNQTSGETIGVEEEQQEQVGAEKFVKYSVAFTMDHPQYMKAEHSNNTWTVYLPFDITLKTSLEGHLEIDIDKLTELKSSDGALIVTTKNISNRNIETNTNFFLDPNGEFDSDICSIIDSEYKAFYVLRSGQTNVFRGMQDSTGKIGSFRGSRPRESAVSALRKEVPLVKRIDRHSSANKKRSFVKSYNSNSDSRHKSNVVLPKSNIEDQKKIISYLRPKQCNRLFVVSRDMSGYEFIHEKDNKKILESFMCDTGLHPQICHASSTTKSYLTWSQKPLYKTWSKSLLTECSYNALSKTGFMKYELSPYLPPDKTWLCDLTRKPVKYPNELYNSLPLLERIDRTQIVLLIRKVLDNRQIPTNIPKLFEDGLINYKQRNEEILEKYKKHKVPTCRTSEEVKEAIDSFFQSAKYLNEGSNKFLKDMSKGDTLTSTSDS